MHLRLFGRSSNSDSLTEAFVKKILFAKQAGVYEQLDVHNFATAWHCRGQRFFPADLQSRESFGLCGDKALALSGMGVQGAGALRTLVDASDQTQN